MTPENVLIKSILAEGAESVTSRQELATESTEDRGRWIERHTGRSREGLRDLQCFGLG